MIHLPFLLIFRFFISFVELKIFVQKLAIFGYKTDYNT